MSVKLYDDAMINKLQKWTRNTHITLIKPDEVRRFFEVNADTSNDSPLRLPAIVLSRSGGYTVIDPSKRPLSFDGATLDSRATEEHNMAIQLNAIPISVSYQIDVFTRYFEEADEFSRNLVFNIINYPKLEVIIPYNNQNYHHEANMRLDPNVEDNSDIPERLISGQFTRQTLKFTIDDAYLFDVRERENYTIYISTDIE